VGLAASLEPTDPGDPGGGGAAASLRFNWHPSLENMVEVVSTVAVHRVSCVVDDSELPLGCHQAELGL
jgi:hypothetical protein